MGIVSTVPDLCIPALETSRELNRLRSSDRVADKGLRGLARRADPHVVPCDEVSPFVVREHDDGAVLHDGELLSRDLRARLTQDLRVLEGDVREQDDARPKDVRRVEAPTETGLDDGDVDVRIRECEERRPRDDLELRRPRALGRGADRLHNRLEVDLLAVEPDPLAPGCDVRGDRRPHREALPEEKLLDRDRCRRLPVRADDVDRGKRVLRIAEHREQLVHSREAETLPWPGRERVEPRGTRAHDRNPLAWIPVVRRPLNHGRGAAAEPAFQEPSSAASSPR